VRAENAGLDLGRIAILNKHHGRERLRGSLFMVGASCWEIWNREWLEQIVD
jgi:hypothetical protein